MSGESIIGFTIFVHTSVHGVGSVLDVRSSVGLGKELQVIMDFVALDKHIIADNRTRLPCYVEIARRFLGRSETTCQAAARSSAGGKTAQGALECGIEVPE